MSKQPDPHTNRPAEPQRFDELEAYRGLAALGIIIFHAYQYTLQSLGGAQLYTGGLRDALLGGLRLNGVFFVLSGLLLFLPFARAAIAQQGPRSARSFLIRRLIRVLPLYYLTLLLVWAWRFVGQPEQLVDLLLHLTFTQTFHQTSIFWTIGPAWSLAVEMHFYLLLFGLGPLAYWLCGKLRGQRQRVALLGLLIGGMAGASLLFKGWVASNPSIAPTNWPFYYNLLAKLDALALGMLLALLVSARPSRPLVGAASALLLGLAGLGLGLAALALHTTSALVQLYYTTLSSSAMALLLSATVLGPRGSRWERALRCPPLQFLGSISYGIYLLHEPIMLELGRAGFFSAAAPAAFPLQTMALFGLTISAATLSYYLIERPSSELRHLFDSQGRLIERYPSYSGPQHVGRSSSTHPR